MSKNQCRAPGSGRRAGRGSAGNVLAALCSFFLPGLGQLVQGRWIRAVAFFVLAAPFYLLGMALWWTIVGLVFFLPALFFHLVSILSAAKYRPAHSC